MRKYFFFPNPSEGKKILILNRYIYRKTITIHRLRDYYIIIINIILHYYDYFFYAGIHNFPNEIANLFSIRIYKNYLKSKKKYFFVN